jgi:DNA-binding PadR family transcriptional regulator
MSRESLIAVEDETAQEREAVQDAADRAWMRGSSPLKGAILSLVLERPGHGYDIGARLGARLGPSWAIDPKRLYRMLDQLERAGLIAGAVEQDPDNPRQQRTVYSATRLAPGALRTWLETLAPREPTRVEIQAKVAAAREQDAPQLVGALRQYECECLELLRQSSGPPLPVRSWMGLVMDIVRDAADAQLRAEIEWAKRTRRRIEEHAARVK